MPLPVRVLMPDYFGCFNCTR